MKNFYHRGHRDSERKEKKPRMGANKKRRPPGKPDGLKKVKAVSIARYGLRRSGSVLLSHSLICSTIAA
ncbi:MAG: hypothetical protein WCH86_04045, partial [Kiritimatiellales bacterium]